MEVYFKPWIGKDYHSQNPKVLVLGESHYGETNGREIDQAFTNRVIRDWALGGEGNHRFFTIIAKISCEVLYNRTPDWFSLDDKQFFWNHVVFYNYIQSFVGDVARIRPSEAMWNGAKEGFLATLDKLKPDIVIVLGSELGRYIQEFAHELTDIAFCYWYHPSAPKYFKRTDAKDELKKVQEEWKNKNNNPSTQITTTEL